MSLHHPFIEAMPKSISLAAERAFSLGQVKVDPPRRCLFADGREYLLEPRAMQVLVALTKADGSVVSRDALIAQCWAGRVVGDDAIYRIIAQLRDVARSTGQAFSIETIPKVGYRLSAAPSPSQVEQTEAKGSEQHPGPERDALSALLVPHLAAADWTRRAALGAIGLGASAALLSLRSGQGDPQYKDLIAQSENAERLDVPESHAKGARLLEQAIRLRPADPLAWGRLALSLKFAAESASAPQLGTFVANAQTAARRALAIDPRQPDAGSALALLPPFYGDWVAAERKLKAVLGDDPAHLATRDGRDFLYAAVGRMREAAANRVGYADADPLHARLAYRLVYAYWNLDEIAAADRAADRALQLWPLHPGVWFVRLWTLAFTGRAQQAQAHLEDAAARPAIPDRTLAVLRRSVQALGTYAGHDIDRARTILLAEIASSPSAAIHGIMVLSALDDLDTAFAVADAYLLERGPLVSALRWRKGDSPINDQHRRKTQMLFTPPAAAMRSDPRFQLLMNDIGLTEYWNKVGATPDHLKQG